MSARVQSLDWLNAALDAAEIDLIHARAERDNALYRENTFKTAHDAAVARAEAAEASAAAIREAATGIINALSSREARELMHRDASFADHYRSLRLAVTGDAGRALLDELRQLRDDNVQKDLLLDGKRELISALREENARLTEAYQEAESERRLQDDEVAKLNEDRESLVICRSQLDAAVQLRDKAQALLARAVAALTKARDHVELPMDIDRDLESEIDAILADPTATAAVEAMRAEQEERATPPQPAHIRCPWCDTRHLDVGEWETRPHHKHKCAACQKLFRVEGEHGEYFYGINDDDHYAGAGHDVAKVDARRGQGGAKPCEWCKPPGSGKDSCEASGRCVSCNGTGRGDS